MNINGVTSLKIGSLSFFFFLVFYRADDKMSGDTETGPSSVQDTALKK